MAIRVAIEGYDDLEQIGVGGMAAVYRARKVSIDKVVAIKVLFPYLATDESYLERFQREAKAAASIQHENIVNVIDFGESEGAFFIVMEYYDGRTLEQLMKERPGLPTEVALRILLEVACGLEAAHALDIVHRDVKPANIIVTNQGGIKIADFGLARKSDSMTMITEHGKVVGTPAYMSPEQAAGRAVGPASDIFSFGVVAYELLGRRKPFEGKTYSEVLEQIQTHQPARVGMVNPLIPPELERVVWRCLEKNEGARYANAGELIADLDAAMEKARVARDRRQLASYVKDPEQYDAAFAEKTIAECLSRGAFFMQKGRSHLDDAVLEYRRVLFLDPAHKRALSSLDRLRVGKNDGTRTVTMDAMPAATAVPSRVPQKRAPRAHKARGWTVGIAATVLLSAGAVFWIMANSRATDHAARETALRTAKPAEAPANDARHDGATSDSARVSLVAPASPKSVPEKPTMSASTSDAGTVTLTEPGHEKPTPAKHVPATKPTVVSKPAPAAVASGSLSVYFLGGVGDVWVDGKLFSRQPPFEKAALAAGTHRVSCRMSGDAESHELTVNIRPGQETVIEYEVGKTPVVSDD
jgi:predicted Ser/Thr protein kinase